LHGTQFSVFPVGTWTNDQKCDLSGQQLSVITNWIKNQFLRYRIIYKSYRVILAISIGGYCNNTNQFSRSFTSRCNDYCRRISPSDHFGNLREGNKFESLERATFMDCRYAYWVCHISRFITSIITRSKKYRYVWLRNFGICGRFGICDDFNSRNNWSFNTQQKKEPTKPTLTLIFARCEK